jgi:HK97 gp10 family phage protein
MSDKVLKLDTKEVDRIMAHLGINTEQLTRSLGFDVEGLAKQNSPIKFGALRSSIYTKTPKFDGSQSAASAATNANPLVETEEAPGVGENTVIVGACVNYAIYQEFGTSSMPAQPYLTPAVEQIVEQWNSGEKWKDLTK